MELLVIADDLTGANACGALFSEDGFQVETKFYWSDHRIDSSAQVTMIDTNSRQSEPVVAQKRLLDMINNYRTAGVRLFANRIDSTMRGNIGTEIEAWLHAFEKESIIVIVPSFPDSGRTVEDGLLYVDGQLMHQTSVGKDPTTPIEDSNISKIIKMQTNVLVTNIALSHVERGPLHLARQFNLEANHNRKVLIVDAKTNEQIDCIAKAMVICERPTYPFDPGPLTYRFMRNILHRKSKSTAKTLVCIGSANQLIETQMMNFTKGRGIVPFVLNPKLFLKPASTVNFSELSEKLIEMFSNEDVVVATTVIPGEQRLSLAEYAANHQMTIEEVSQKITNGFATFIFFNTQKGEIHKWVFYERRRFYHGTL
ncbi:four-carbon acid sugar kinase family protein [Geomicrobium sp. JCM 19055]|uniref:four-carbon acid sugar kinase family protein n=1 Tax=Geomicrobium sp. JCM 19055 TaxID=1460649 RepID=UPI00045EDDDF|nr:four-carbon acid sugar kinase family protein [Geomicrobium sp. JCM 19055]GAK00601.1 candidate type III effector Hop protein [Geomicrobium sp. JCM 19055]